MQSAERWVPSGHRSLSTAVGAILAGGNATRLANKASSTVGGLAIIQRVVNALGPVCKDILLVVGEDDDYAGVELPRVCDEFRDCGPLGGIHAALKAAGQPCLVVACDMPFLNSELFQYMIDEAEDYEAVVPFLAGRFEPLHALYSPLCLPSIEESLTRHVVRGPSTKKTGPSSRWTDFSPARRPQATLKGRTTCSVVGRQANLGLTNLFLHLRLRKITEEEIAGFGDPQLLFFNVNTAEDLRLANQMARSLTLRF